MALYCTIADLQVRLSATKLATLAYDGSGTASISDATVVAVLTQYMTDASNEARAALLGRVDLEDTQVLADLKRAAVTLTLYALFIRRGHYGLANPYLEDAKAVRDELKAIRKGELSTGVTASPSRTIVAVTTDDDPVFAPNSDGESPSIMRDW